MALTSLDTIYKLNTTEIGYTMDSGNAPSKGGVVPLYIPRLMPGIGNGKPTTTKISSKGASVFKNSPQCTIRADSVITATNYIDVKFQGNRKWTSSDADIDPRNGHRKIARGVQVTCYNRTNVIGDMTFSND